MEYKAYFQEFWISTLLMVTVLSVGESSHLLNPRRTSGRYLNIQDRVLESCRGHFMCEVFPYYDSFGLNCLNVSRVCDGTRHCRDGSDELQDVCSGLRRSNTELNRTLSGDMQGLRGAGNRVVRLIRTGTLNSSSWQKYGSNADSNPDSIALKSKNKTQERKINKIETITEASPILTIDSTTYPPAQKTQDSAPSRRRSQSSRRGMFENLSRFMQLGNPFSSFGMLANNRETSSGFQTDYYTARSRGRNLGTNINNELQSGMMRRRPFEAGNHRQLSYSVGLENKTSARSRQFVDRRMPFPGSSYLDTQVSTPSPIIPDGFVHKPGKEPHISAEEQFLEQQFYLTNELPGHVPHGKQGPQKDHSGAVTDTKQILNQMQTSRARQARLLRQQFFRQISPIATNDINRERYGVSGPFDGGVPSVPGEVKGLQNMEGSEAQNALHNIEALH